VRLFAVILSLDGETGINSKRRYFGHGSIIQIMRIVSPVDTITTQATTEITVKCV
jgi:hypothetical protein